MFFNLLCILTAEMAALKDSPKNLLTHIWSVRKQPSSSNPTNGLFVGQKRKDSFNVINGGGSKKDQSNLLKLIFAPRNVVLTFNKNEADEESNYNGDFQPNIEDGEIQMEPSNDAKIEGGEMVVQSSSKDISSFMTDRDLETTYNNIQLITEMPLSKNVDETDLTQFGQSNANLLTENSNQLKDLKINEDELTNIYEEQHSINSETEIVQRDKIDSSNLDQIEHDNDNSMLSSHSSDGKILDSLLTRSENDGDDQQINYELETLQNEDDDAAPKKYINDKHKFPIEDIQDSETSAPIAMLIQSKPKALLPEVSNVEIVELDSVADDSVADDTENAPNSNIRENSSAPQSNIEHQFVVNSENVYIEKESGEMDGKTEHILNEKEFLSRPTTVYDSPQTSADKSVKVAFIPEQLPEPIYELSPPSTNQMFIPQKVRGIISNSQRYHKTSYEYPLIYIENPLSYQENGVRGSGAFFVVDDNHRGTAVVADSERQNVGGEEDFMQADETEVNETVKRDIENAAELPFNYKLKDANSDLNVASIETKRIRPGKRPSFIEMLENETSSEKAERIQKALQRLMHAVTIVGHVDSYISRKFRNGIKQFARAFDSVENLRSS